MITKEDIRKEMIKYCHTKNISVKAFARRLGTKHSNIALAYNNHRPLSYKVINLLIRYWTEESSNK